jgi:dienelactone hydrolase
VTGTYRQPEAMGLFRSMTSTGGTDSLNPPMSDMRIALTVRDGDRTLAGRTVTRVFATSGVTARELTLARDGFIGHYYTPPAGAAPRSAVLVLGGGEGGLGGYLDATAGLLASHGHPALAVGYFGLPGLPVQLADLRLEYLIGALSWLRGQPGLAAVPVFVYGVSRGGEAALLLGSLRPDLVHGVAAMVPSNVVHCAFGACAGPSWTLGGVAVPFTRQFTTAEPTDEPAAVIPVERVAGPVLLVCGEADVEWPSCLYARAADARLAGRPGAQRHVLLAYPGAGHKVGLLVPYQPDDGGPLDGQGQADAWPRVLDLLGA